MQVYPWVHGTQLKFYFNHLARSIALLPASAPLTDAGAKERPQGTTRVEFDGVWRQGLAPDAFFPLRKGAEISRKQSEGRDPSVRLPGSPSAGGGATKP